MSTVLVALSGGVDSSVSAALLLREGHRVHGVFMSNGVGEKARTGGAVRPSCAGGKAAEAARAVAGELGIPFHVIDLRLEFAHLIDRFVQEYRYGRTPNPCLVCNRRHKFGRLLALADELGCEHLATGHYAILEHRSEQVHLMRARDARKDQSYVLSQVPEAALRRARLPLGEFCKPRVREIAASLGLSSGTAPESQEICFVPSGDYRDLLDERGLPSRPGAIVDSSGAVLGEHRGTEGFTIGQRRGLGIAHSEPLYVLAIRPAEGEIVVGPRCELGCRSFALSAMNWIGMEPPEVGARLSCEIQIRSSHRARPGVVVVGAGGRMRATFDEPVDAVAPGQGAALYAGRRCLGGGWIEATQPSSAVVRGGGAGEGGGEQAARDENPAQW